MGFELPPPTCLQDSHKTDEKLFGTNPVEYIPSSVNTEALDSCHNAPKSAVLNVMFQRKFYGKLLDPVLGRSSITPPPTIKLLALPLDISICIILHYAVTLTFDLLISGSMPAIEQMSTSSVLIAQVVYFSAWTHRDTDTQTYKVR